MIFKINTGNTMKIFTLSLLMLFALNLSADSNKLSATPYNIAKIYIGHGQPYFLEVGAEDCPSCKIMAKVLYTLKKENP